MAWSFVGPAVLSLAGVVLGTGGSLLAQYLANRVSAQQARLDHAMALRAERRATILEFLDTVQRAERLTEDLRDGRADREDNEAAEVTHRLWVLEKNLKLICSKPLADATYAYVCRVKDSIWTGQPASQEELWTFLDDVREPFLQSAKRELQAM